MRVEIKCNDKRKCFANKDGKCTLLTSSYKTGTCPFAKPVRFVTDGIVYSKRLREF